MLATNAAALGLALAVSRWPSDIVWGEYGRYEYGTSMVGTILLIFASL